MMIVGDENACPQIESTAKKAPSKAGGKKGGRTIEEMYQKKSQLEHILLRPDTYGKPPRPTQLWRLSHPLTPDVL